MNGDFEYPRQYKNELQIQEENSMLEKYARGEFPKLTISQAWTLRRLASGNWFRLRYDCKIGEERKGRWITTQPPAPNEKYHTVRARSLPGLFRLGLCEFEHPPIGNESPTDWGLVRISEFGKKHPCLNLTPPRYDFVDDGLPVYRGPDANPEGDESNE